MVSIDEVRSHNAELAEGLLLHPFDFAQAFDQALKNIVAAIPNATPKQTSEDTMYYCRAVLDNMLAILEHSLRLT